MTGALLWVAYLILSGAAIGAGLAGRLDLMILCTGPLAAVLVLLAVKQRRQLARAARDVRTEKVDI